jgi:hypothetical protein
VKQQLEAARMTDEALWNRLQHELRMMHHPPYSTMLGSEYGGRLQRALECAYELHQRGTQLTLQG